MTQFKRALCFSMLLAVTQLATAQTGRGSTIDGKAVANAIHDFGVELRTNVANDAAVWRERRDKMRQEIRTLFNTDESHRRRLLQNGTTDVTSQNLGASWELILNAGGALKNVIDAKKVKIHDFFAEMMGTNWASFLPNFFRNASLSWDQLGMFDFQSNLQDLLNPQDVTLLQMPQNLGQLYNNMELINHAFCTEIGPITPAKVPTSCIGPKVVISYLPKTCAIDNIRKEVICDPAKLVLYKIPGQCTFKYHPAFVWVGKQCQFKAQIGLKKETIIGGGNYTIDLTELVHDKTAAAINHILPEAPVTVTSLAVTGQPLQRRILWTPSEKYSLEGVYRFVITCTASPTDIRIAKVFKDKDEVIIGAAAAGDNGPLTAGATYVCSVSAINFAGTGPGTNADAFTVPAAS